MNKYIDDNVPVNDPMRRFSTRKQQRIHRCIVVCNIYVLLVILLSTLHSIGELSFSDSIMIVLLLTAIVTDIASYIFAKKNNLKCDTISLTSPFLFFGLLAILIL